MRVLHALNELRFSGAERMLLAAAPRFAAEGIQSTLLAVGDAPGPMAGLLAEAGYAVRHLPFAPSAAFLGAFRRLVADNYDVVHIHAERANFWLAAMARMAGVPQVLRTVHARFEFAGMLRIERLAQRRLMTLAGVRHIAISASVQAVEWDRFRNPTTLVPNWYDDRHFRVPTGAERAAARAELGVADHQTAVVSIGNCAAVKGHPTLIQALARYSGARDLLYLHAGEEEAGAPERRLCAELGLADRVRFLGPCADVRRVLHAADLYVMPSIREGFGIAALEAFACGLPVILTDAPGLRDFRRHFRYAEVPVGDPDALARRIDLTATGLPLREQAETAARHYGVEAGASAYLRLYRAGAPGAPDSTSASAAS